MFAKIFVFLKNNKTQLIKYAVIGGSAFLLDMSTLIFLKEKLELQPVLAVAMNQLLVINYVFFLNKHWSFKSNGRARDEMTRFIILVIWNYIFSVAFMWLWINLFHVTFYLPWWKNKDIGYIAGRVVSIVVMVSWNFLIYKYWVYKNPLVEPN